MLTYHQVDAMTQGHFRTGPLRHDVIAGITWLRQMFDADAASGTTSAIEYGNIYSSRPVLTNASDYNPGFTAISIISRSPRSGAIQ